MWVVKATDIPDPVIGDDSPQAKPAKPMEMQCLSPQLSHESGSVPINGVWAAMAKLPTAVALTFRGGMESLS